MCANGKDRAHKKPPKKDQQSEIMMKNAVLTARNLSISFTQYTNGFHTRYITPVHSLNVSIAEGEILAVIGASGSGKSLLAHAILGILPQNASVSGEIYYKDVLLTPETVRQFRGKEIAFIPQSVTYLDPLMKTQQQIRIGLPKKEAAHLQRELFKQYGLAEEADNLYPFQLSGGMLRRILFATSVRAGIKLIIADEPTPGIHPEALESVLQQLRRFADEGIAVMLITHDIMSAVKIADYVTIFNEGENIETASASAFSGNGAALKTDYAKRLWRALPQNDFIQAV